MLTAIELASMIIEQEKTMTATVIIQRSTDIINSEGAFVSGYATVVTVACRYYRKTTTPTEQTTNAQLDTRILWNVEVPHDTEVFPDDQILINDMTLQVLSGYPNILASAIVIEAVQRG